MIYRAVIVALFFLGVAPALADQRGEALMREYVDWADSSPDWSASVAILRSDSRYTIAEGLVFSRGDPDVSISIERLRIRDLARSPDGGFQATRMIMDGAAVAAEGISYAAPTATIESISVPSMEGLSFDPHNIMTFFAQAYSRLAKARFSNLTIPEVTGKVEPDSGAGVSAEVVYSNLSVAELRNGIMDRMSAGPITLQETGPDGNFEFTIESASSNRTDIGAFAHVFDPAQYEDGKGDGIWRPILSDLTYTNITGAGPDGFTLKLDTMAFENLDGRQLDEPFTDTWDKLLDISIPEDEKAELALDLLRSYAAWRLGTVRLHGFGMEAPAEEVSFTLDEVTVSGLSGEGIDSFIVTNLAGSGPDGFLSLGSLELAGFVSPDFEALIGFAGLEPDADPKMHAEAITKTFAALPRLSHFGLRDLSAGESKDVSVSLDSFTLDFSDWNDIFAEATDMKVIGLTVPPMAFGEAAPMLEQLNYDEIVLGMTVSDRWTPETGTDEATWSFSLRDGGDISLSYVLNGITEEWMVDATAAAAKTEGSEEALMAMLDGLSLESATLTATDRSLLDRGFSIAATMQNLDVDGPTYREQMRAAFPFLMSAALPPPLINLLTAPVQEFLGGGRTLIAEIMPDRPLKVMELSAAAEDPLSLPDLLNLELRTEPIAQQE
jgi:predicted ester cyclase